MNVYSGVVVVILVVGMATSQAVASEERKESPSEFGAEKCSEVKGIDNAVTCVAMTTLRRLEDLSIKENIEIMPGILLTSDIPKFERESRQKRTMELPKTAEERINRIFDMMFNVMNNLFAGRTLKIKMSEDTNNSVIRAFEEGRGKMKKLAGPLIMALGAKMLAIVPILMGGLALFASKALLVSKLALILALIVGAQYLFSSGGNFLNRFGGGWNNGGSYGGSNSGGHNYIGAYGAPAWNTQSSQSYPYARSLNEAQELAYSSHKQ